jgi:hypothetical protein
VLVVKNENGLSSFLGSFFLITWSILEKESPLSRASFSYL